ncbi:MAG: class I SAM-dependent methyltransferase [Bacteroidia bacterium]|nr:class I SAM-dependent methyltransferase [Bacteroidia bacterium]MDW8088655.1 class I SAM-dependent methyltransferase [Bacteroidia bacterium]
MGAALIEAFGRWLWLSVGGGYPPALAMVTQLYKTLRRAKGLILGVEVYGARYPAAQWGQIRWLSLAALTRQASCTPAKGRLLYRLVAPRRPQRILELGTHLGLGTLYLACSAPKAEIHTVEASPTLASYAKKHFQILGLHPTLHCQTFEAFLSQPQPVWDVVFLDGNHGGAAFVGYIKALYPSLAEGGLLIADDIFWSRDMYAAWRRVSALSWRKAWVVGPFGVLEK